MSLPQMPGPYGLGPTEGEALWFNGSLSVLKATTESTDGRFAAMEILGPKGFGAPLHIHASEDEFFIVMSGDVRVRHGDDIFEATAGSLVYGPREVPHSFTVDSEEARLLLFFAPGGVEGFFREAGKPAGALEIPPPDEEFLDRETVKAIAGKYGQEFVGPPLPPKD
jgi:mannose-6-phosphate isomerase-like protein (cupin superfamily)